MSTSDVVGMAKARIKLDCGLDQLYDLSKPASLTAIWRATAAKSQ
jgi:hypothetical protein